MSRRARIVCSACDGVCVLLDYDDDARVIEQDVERFVSRDDELRECLCSCGHHSDSRIDDGVVVRSVNWLHLLHPSC